MGRCLKSQQVFQIQAGVLNLGGCPSSRQAGSYVSSPHAPQGWRLNQGSDVMGTQAEVRVSVGQVSDCPEQWGRRRRMWEAWAPCGVRAVAWGEVWWAVVSWDTGA